MIIDTKNKLPNVFLSYSWKDRVIADEIDNDFKAIGITFRRDVRDAVYRTSIKEFMNTLGNHDYVVMLISDDYLRSANCMYEVTELLNTHEFEKRILPVLLESAKGIFNEDGTDVYYDYWENKLAETNNKLSKRVKQDLLDDKRKIENIINHLDIFFVKIKDMILQDFKTLKTNNYKPILDIIGIDSLKTSELIQYKEAIEMLARTKSPYSFINSNQANAAVTLSAIIKYSEKEIRIYDNDLTDIADMNDDFYINLKDFLQNGKTAKIVIRDVGHRKNIENKLQKYFNVFSSRLDIRSASEVFDKEIKNKFGKLINFAVGDSASYRYETEDAISSSRNALCCFNDQVTANNFIDAFDSNFNSCVKLSEP